MVKASSKLNGYNETGFAFGMGVERTLMSQHDLAEIRDLVEGDVRVSLSLGQER